MSKHPGATAVVVILLAALVGAPLFAWLASWSYYAFNTLLPWPEGL